MSRPEPSAVVIDWKQLLVYLALALGLFLLAYELIEVAADTMGIVNQGRGRRTLFGALALCSSWLVLRLLVRRLDFMPRPDKRDRD